MENNIIEDVVDWVERLKGLDRKHRNRQVMSLLQERLYWRIVSYMQRFPERLTSNGQVYSDRCVGGEELRLFMGFQEEGGYCKQWLEKHHVASLSVARKKLLSLNAQISEILSYDLDIPICYFRDNFGLSDVELEVLVSLILSMSVESLLRMMTVAWSDFSVRQATVSFMCDLLSDGADEYEKVLMSLSARGCLQRIRLVIAERHSCFPNYTPIAYAPLAVEQCVIDAFLDVSGEESLTSKMKIHRKGIDLGSLIIERGILEDVRYVLEESPSHLLVVGAKHSGRRTLLCSLLCSKQGKTLLEVDMRHELERISSSQVEFRFAEILREALLKNAEIMLRFDGVEDSESLMRMWEDNRFALMESVRYYPRKIILLAHKSLSIFMESFFNPSVVHLDLPNVEVSRMAWTRALGGRVEESEVKRMVDSFSQNYVLSLGMIFNVVDSAYEKNVRGMGEGFGMLESHHILNEIRQSFEHDLGSLADISVSEVSLSGVVLNEECQSQVNEILEYAKNIHHVLEEWGFRKCSPYGNALSVLFTGPPGTGKTLLANAMANELGKVLYRVDLSRVVDKYIGETEKKLAQIFEEASKAQAIILFDEADSLFSKRTEVKSSNDRYANLEVNFLLQKLESYSGITILTTNLSSSIDDAFRRRIRFIVDFPMPDSDARVRLWKRLMPPKAPLSDDIDWEWLGESFEMSGGHIRNIILKAGIRASSLQKPIDMEMIVKAALDESRSMGKLVRVEDFDSFMGGSYDEW